MSFNVVNAGTIAAIITADNSRFTSGVSGALASLETLTSGTASFNDKVLALGKGMEDLGVAMTVFVSAPVAGALIASSVAAMRFESAMTGVAKTTNMTDSELAEMSKDILDMSKEIPVTTAELASIAEAAGQLGIQTSSIEGFTETMAMMASSTNMEAAEAATQMARFANITAMSQNDFDRLGSTIVSLGNNFATTEAEIMEAAQRLAGAGALVGMAEDEILAMAAAYTSLGINIEAGGTAVSRVIRDINTQVLTSGENLGVFAETAGMSVESFSEAWRTDAASAFDSVVKGLNRVYESGGNVIEVLTNMGFTELRVVDTMSRLATSGTVLTSALSNAEQAWRDNNALQQEAERRYATTESQIELLSNQVNVLGVQFGNILLPSIRNMVDGARDLLNWIENLDEGTKENIVTTAKWVVALGPMLLVGGKVVTVVGNMTKAYQAVAAATTVAEAAAALSSRSLANYAKVLMGLPMLIKKTALAKLEAAAADTAATAASAANAAATGTATVATGASAAATGAATVATNAHTVATGVATAATKTFYTVVSAHPFAAAAIAVTALVAGVGALVYAVAKASDGEEDYTQATVKNKKAVEDAKVAYDKAVKAHGETSDEALKAKASLDEATMAYENSKMTVEEWTKAVEESVEASREARASADEMVSDAQSQAGAILNLVDRYNELTSVESRNEEQKARLYDTVMALNDSVPGLSVVYDQNTDSIVGNTAAIAGLARAEAERLQNQADLEAYNEVLAGMPELYQRQKEAQEEETAAAAEYQKAMDNITQTQQHQLSVFGVSYGEVNKTREAWSDSKETLESVNQEVADAEQRLLDLAEGARKAREYEDNLSAAIAAVRNGFMDAAQAEEKYGIASELIESKLAATTESATEMETVLYDLIGMMPNLYQEFTNAGIGVDDLAQKLVDLGYDTETVVQQLDGLVTAAQDGVNRIQATTMELTEGNANALQQMNANYDYNQECIQIWADSIDTIMRKTGRDASDAWIQSLVAMGPEGYAILQELATGTAEELNYTAENFAESGSDAASAYLQALGILDEEGLTILDGVETALDTKMQSMGEALPSGFATGVTNAAQQAVKASADMAVAAADAAAQELGVNSPSRVYMEFGNYCAQGLAIGFRQSIGMFSASIASAVDTAAGQASPLIEQFRQIGASSMDALNGSARSGSHTFSNILNANLTSAVNSSRRVLSDGFRTVGTSMAQALATTSMQGLQTWAASTASMLKSSISRLAKMSESGMSSVGSVSAVGFHKGFSGVFSSMIGKITAMVASGASSAKSVGYPAFYSAGANAASGLAAGITSQRSVVVSAATAVANAASTAMRNALKIKSPSKVTQAIGEYVGQGLGLGMLGEIGYVDRASKLLADAAVPVPTLPTKVSGYVPESGYGSDPWVRNEVGFDYAALAEAVGATVARQQAEGPNGTDAVVAKLDGVVEAISNMRVDMDGRTVGKVLTPYVDRNMGRNAVVKGGGL